MYSFNPHHLFPSSGTSSSTSTLLPCSKGVALTGSLPISTLLHLSFSHLRHGNSATSSSISSTTPYDSKVKGKETKIEPHVLIISPDRNKLQESLIEENEESLRSMRCDGESVKLLEKIEFKYLPTTAHLRYFLMTLYTYDSPPTAHQAYKTSISGAINISTNAKGKGKLKENDPSYLEKVPTLVILHDLSIYLAEDENQKIGLESYASLLALFTSTFSNLSTRTKVPFLILHDRHSTNTLIPVLASHLRRKQSRTKRKRSRRDEAEEGSDEDMAREWREDEEEEMGGGAGAGEEDGERIEVERIMSCFFDWVGKVGRSEGDPSSELEGSSYFTLKIKKSNRMLLPNQGEINYNQSDPEVKEARVDFLIERSQALEKSVSTRIEIKEF